MKKRCVGWVAKRFLRLGVLLAVLLAVASCAGSEEPTGGEIPAPAGLPITFNVPSSPPVEWPTKGTITNDALLNKVGIYAYSHVSSTLGGGWANVGASPRADYFVNRTVIRTGGTWAYSGVVKYWPDDSRQVSFFAYAPYSDVGNTIIVSPLLATPVGIPTLAFDTPSDVLKQVDLLWDSKQNLGVVSGSAPTVSLVMKPALAAVYFAVDIDEGSDFATQEGTMRVKKITVTNILSRGTLRLDNGTWSSRNALRNYELVPNRGILDQEIKYVEGNLRHFISNVNTTDNSGDGFLMFIPQTLNNDTHIIFDIELTMNGTTEIQQYDSGPLPNTMTLEAGRLNLFLFNNLFGGSANFL